MKSTVKLNIATAQWIVGVDGRRKEISNRHILSLGSEQNQQEYSEAPKFWRRQTDKLSKSLLLCNTAERK